MSGDIVLKKRFVRLVEKFSGGEMPRGWRHGAEAYRLATLMLDLAQNEARCRDGLSDYLHAHERKFLGLMGAAPAERAQTFVPLQKMGERLARIFLEYRSDYVSQYFSCLEPSIETQTEGRELIRARMRLPLGLAGSFVDVLHPGFGQGERDIFEPNRIIHCLLEGGALFIAGGTPRYIPPYDPVLLLKLTQDTLGKETQFLYDGFVQYRPDIREKYEKAFTSFEDNVYVRPNADPQEESLFTEKFFEELLVFYGYLKRKG